jgi:hypothetical protein
MTLRIGVSATRSKHSELMLSIVLQLCSFFHGELEMPYELAMTPSGKSLKIEFFPAMWLTSKSIYIPTSGSTP